MNTKPLVISALICIAPSAAFAEEIDITVKGMVCSFCAQGLKKAFTAMPGVERVEPDLDKKLIVVTTKDKAVLSDVDVTKVVNDAGYDVVKVERK